jgi:hypothetical protein
MIAALERTFFRGGRTGRFWPVLMAVSLAGMAVCALAHRHLYADGSYFLVMILPSRSFTAFDVSRQHAHYLLEAPLWVALNWLRITDVRILSWIFGLTLFLHPVASLWACWWILRRRNRALMILPALCWACLTLTTSFFIISESWVGVSLFWPIYFLLVFRRHALTDAEDVILVACSFAAVRVYEGFALPASLLLLLAVRRLLWQWRQKARLDGWTMASLACLIGAVVAETYWGLFPRDPNNRATGLQGLHQLFGYPQGILLLAAVVLFAGPRWRSRQLARWGGFALAGLALLWGLQPWRAASNVHANQHADVRLINNLLPILLALSPLAASRFRALRFTFDSSRKAAFAAFTAAVLVWQAGASWSWSRYLHHFSQVLASSQGYLETKPTGLPDFGFEWGWTNPSLSVVLGAMRREPLRAIVLNASDAGWQPFDPRKPDQLPDLRQYGLTYNLPAGPTSATATPSR